MAVSGAKHERKKTMPKVRIRYLGRRTPLELKMPWLEEPVAFRTNEPIQMNAKDALRLVRENPNSFKVLYPSGKEQSPAVEEQVEVEEALEEVSTEEQEPQGPPSKSIYHMNKTELAVFIKEKSGVEIDPAMNSREAMLNRAKDLAKKGNGDDSA